MNEYVSAVVLAETIIVTHHATANTIEQAAVDSGRLAGRFTQIRFHCLAAGFPFTTDPEAFSGMAKFAVEMRKTYPDFFDHRQ